MANPGQRRRGLKSAQILQRILNFTLSGVPATPVAGGFDQYGIKQVIDLGAGNYTVIFKYPFERACQLAGHASLTSGILVQVTAVDFDRITIQCRDAAGVATDANLHLSVIGSDSRYDV
jgi:hypothetical protein